MAKDDSSKITTRLGQKKWVLIAAAAVAVCVIAFILLVIFFGMQAANPWGEAPGPGP